MAAEFRSLAEILRAERAVAPEPLPAPPISPLISQEPPAPARELRLQAARREERWERALERLLEEIAAEVLGRELLLAPVDVDAIVRRLVARYGFEGDDVDVVARDGDVELVLGEDRIDASFWRRMRAAIDRALR